MQFCCANSILLGTAFDNKHSNCHLPSCLQAQGMQSEYLRATSKDDSSSAGQRSDKSEVSKLISEKARLQDALETAQVGQV
jgi:hypothetical protein